MLRPASIRKLGKRKKGNFRHHDHRKTSENRHHRANNECELPAKARPDFSSSFMRGESAKLLYPKAIAVTVEGLPRAYSFEVFLPMRLLVQCPECQRQYDATQRQIGSRFRCHCGAVVTVQQPKGHEARVVRCSSCGAARGDDNADRYAYCHSSFTLHERDLNTVCPHCLGSSAIGPASAITAARGSCPNSMPAARLI